ncbi:unnamed protein product [Rotaria sordida]|uniref:Uncharacterized protein n=1 Tax=Rotaria sordida TaxID=392033 RepID=A0A818NEC8_9BILA|nr:unnamed protein product [Rotaria sordida]
MSLKEEQPQKPDLRAGLAIFNSNMIPNKNLDGNEKSNDEASIKKESTPFNNASSTRDSQLTPTSLPSNVKPVGSNRRVADFHIIQFCDLFGKC